MFKEMMGGSTAWLEGFLLEKPPLPNFPDYLDQSFLTSTLLTFGVGSFFVVGPVQRIATFSCIPGLTQ